MLVILGDMVDDAGFSTVRIGAAGILESAVSPVAAFHERRQREDRSWLLTMTVSSDIAGT